MRATVCALLAAAHPVLACEPALKGSDVHRIEGRIYVVAWQAAPMHVSEFFTLEVAACANAGPAPTALRVDAVMPAHKHGMNYLPKVESAGAGRFRAEGLMLHMPGAWELSFDVRGSQGNETLREGISLR